MAKEEILDNGRVPVIGIKRHRISTDGEGVTTLVGFWGCPLQCKYCLNKECHSEEGVVGYYSVEELYRKVAVDDLYFQASGGGVTFGGGEPLLRSGFIKDFKKWCGAKWRITVETSLNVPRGNVEELLDVVDEWIVDVKDWQDETYEAYTGVSSELMKENLALLVDRGLADKVMVRVPIIEGYNTPDCALETKHRLMKIGITRVNIFNYCVGLEEMGEAENKNEVGSMGKRICDVLRQLRVDVAEKYGITYSPRICEHDVCATGSCPMCDFELSRITRRLKWKVIRETEGNLLDNIVELNGMSFNVGRDIGRPLMGSIAPEHDAKFEMKVDEKEFKNLFSKIPPFLKEEKDD